MSKTKRDKRETTVDQDQDQYYHDYMSHERIQFRARREQTGKVDGGYRVMRKRIEDED